MVKKEEIINNVSISKLWAEPTSVLLTRSSSLTRQKVYLTGMLALRMRSQVGFRLCPKGCFAAIYCYTVILCHSRRKPDCGTIPQRSAASED